MVLYGDDNGSDHYDDDGHSARTFLFDLSIIMIFFVC